MIDAVRINSINALNAFWRLRLSKYRPLRHFLESRQTDQTPLTFAEVEDILGFPLPPSARAGPSWWSNNTGSHVGVRAWRDAGWKASRVDVPGERVVFVRDRDAAAVRSSESASGAEESLCVERRALSAAATRLLGDYSAEVNGDTSAALARAVHEAAVARRGRLVRQWMASAPRMPAGEPDSATLIREDRDVR
ncbi:MAG TPA: hypothetical protein VFC47_07025 [Caulobacteraceae bacterium]|nr:hypothetical protein [Caulobacteraceae bacterium]